MLFMFYNMKNLHVIQPYQVGSKHSKSLAIVIPSPVVKQYQISPSTVLMLRTEENTKQITLQIAKELTQEF
jgi:hypothetical protein